MTIAQLLSMPVDTKVGGFDVIVKTAKKKWQVGDKWIHQVLLMDETGEMLADVNIGINKPMIRGQKFRVIVSEIQAAEKGIKLYVDQFQIETITEPPDIMAFAENECTKVVTGKIKTWLVAGCLQSGTPTNEVDKAAINSLADWVMK